MRIYLRHRIAALTLLCLLPVVAVSSWALVRLATGYLWDEAEADAFRLADAARRVTRHAMLQNEQKHVLAVLNDLGQQPETRYLRLYDLRGRLKASTAGRGQNLASSGCVRCHVDPLREAPPPGSCTHWEESTLRVYRPIPNEAACGGPSCHPVPGIAPNLGFLEVATDVSRIASRAHDVRLHGVLWSVVVLVAAAVPLLFGLGWAVERPLAESLRLIGEVSRENFAVRSRLRRSDEWADLWAAFDSMASTLGQARADLETLNWGLERQVADRTSQLQSALEAAQESDRMKTQFLANISHEFSTPLQAVIGYAELLLDGIDGHLPGDQRRDVEAIYRNGRRLLDWVEDLLELARLDGRTRFLCVDRIRVQDLAEEAAEAGRKIAAGKPVSVVYESHPACPPVLGEVGALRRVLSHLVENAARHTQQGRVAIRVLPAEGGWAEVQVEDTGPGIDPDVLEAALKGFASKGGGGGLAVGLTLARRLVELHGGSFRAESALGKGTRIIVLLPGAPPAEVVPIPDEEPASTRA